MTHLLQRLVMIALFLFPTFPLATAQKFLPDDPIQRDPDNLSIPQPAFFQLSPTYDLLENTFGSEADKVLVTAVNVNTTGEVPDSSWFTNRIGLREMSAEEVATGAAVGTGPQGTLTVVRAGLAAFLEGLAVEDERGRSYYLSFDRKGYPNLATGAHIITSRFLHAIGYNVFPGYLAWIDPRDLRIDPAAQILTLSEVTGSVDEEFLRLFFEKWESSADGKFRAVAVELPPTMIGVGEFKFYGTRPDDPNDIFLHENRRELRGLKVFAAWLNHYLSRSINTRDFYVTEGDRSFLKHYLIDFAASLGSGQDLDEQIIPKDPRSGYEYNIWGDTAATLKTAFTLGIWERPWMKLDYPLKEYPEIGRIEGDYFDPADWVPEYPNPAFDRMLPDDALWAAQLLARFDDPTIRAVVGTAEYDDPRAAEYLVESLIKRRDKLVDYHYRQISPLHGFRIADSLLYFDNLGEKRGLASDSSYQYQWFELNNQTEQLVSLTDPLFTGLTQIPIPVSDAEYLMVRIRTRSDQQRGWSKNVEVFLRTTDRPEILGIEREVGVLTLQRTLEGRLEVRSTIEFGGTYEGLEDEQRELVNDWFARFNQLVGKEVDSAEGYNKLPLSQRTTFEAATHALVESTLTDEKGKSLGRAIDLIEKIDAVHGRIQRAGGDEQFRIYVTLKPNVRNILEESQQFRRTADNTIYHKGFPISYRQDGNYPSVQFSISEDETRADIDVDYRSSKFPQALINGHLTAANSDVRAGGNFNKHIGRWEGLQNWWRGIFGLPFMTEILGELDPEEKMIPLTPDQGKGELEEAVRDFLESWLVRKTPERSVSYVSPRAYSCLPVWGESGQVDYGIAPYVLLDRMAAAANEAGQIGSINQVIFGVNLQDDRFEPLATEQAQPFKLYSVPENLALSMDCSARNQAVAATAEVTDRRGRYFVSAFGISGQQESGTMALLWNREDGIWRIVSYDSDLRPEEIEVPDLRQAPVVTLARVEGDPDFLSANGTFLTAWRDGDIETAMSFISRQSYPCLRFYSDAGAGASDSEVEQALRQGLRRVADKLAQGATVEEVASPVEFVHPDIRIVSHDRESVFSLAAVPDYLGIAYSCENLGKTAGETEEKTYSDFYATALKLKLVGQDGAALYLLWSKESGNWRIIAIHIVAP